MVAERRACRPQQHALASQRRRAAQDVRTPTVPWSPCPCLPSASACSASTRPASGVRCVSSVRLSGSARPVSRVRCPMSGVRVQCPVSTSGVRCPMQASGIRACRVCVRSVRTGEFMECEGAVAATRLGTGRVGVSPHHVCDRLVGCPTPLESGTSLVRDNQALVTTSRTSITCSYPAPSEPRSDRC